MHRRQKSGTEETYTNCTDCTFSWGKDTILYCMYSMARQHSGTNCINSAVSSQGISKQTNAVSRSNISQTMLEGACGCFMTCNVFLADNSEVSLELQCFTAELITYIVCECYAPEWNKHCKECDRSHARWWGRLYGVSRMTRVYRVNKVYRVYSIEWWSGSGNSINVVWQSVQSVNSVQSI